MEIKALAEATGVDLPEQLVSEAGADVAYVGTPSMNKPRVSSKDKADAIPATAEVAA